MDLKFLTFQNAKPTNPIYSLLASYGEVVAFNGSQDATDYALAVVDGASYTPADITAQLAQLTAGLEGNVPLLLLDATAEHKEALAPTIRCWSESTSLGYFIYPVLDQYKNRRYSLVEQFDVRKPDGKLMAAEARRGRDGEVTLSDAVELAASDEVAEITTSDLSAFSADVRGVVRQLQENGAVDAVVTPPQGCPYWAYPYKVYQPWNVGGSSSPSATVTVSGTSEVGIYWDDLTYSKPIQWLLLNNFGNFSSDIVVNSDSELGWSIGGFKINGPNLAGSSQGDFSLYQSSPQSVSGQTQYTSSTGFSVGVSAGTDGLSENASYTVSNSETQNLNDWEITLTGDDSWNFYQQNPYNGESQGFPDGAEDDGYVASLPSISTSALSYNSQTVWLVETPLTNTQGFTYSFVSYPTCITFSDTGKSWHATFHYYDGGITFNQTFNADFGPANPNS